jgi:alpha-tubulin suppressor-like RCC1 family protein
LGVYKDVLVPRFISGLKGFTARWIASSNHHTAIVTQEGMLMVCGSSLHGKLGIEGLNKTNINKLLSVPALAKRKVKQVACGDYNTLCLLEDSTVYQFGGSLHKDKKDKQ